MSERNREDLFRRIPSVDALLNDEDVQRCLHGYPRKLQVDAMRAVAARWRDRIGAREGPHLDLSPEAFVEEVAADLISRGRASLRHIINATGVILNTNLGRAPLLRDALESMVDVAAGYSNLEVVLESGNRGERYLHVEEYLNEISGAEASLVVNNNAAAVLLILDTFARGKEVIVSRGELIEIGGSFRLPDVLKKSGALLKEVGTTNRTYLRDYEEAIGDETAILFRSHPSNYRVIGFTHRPSVDELTELGRRRNLLTVEDLGSGLLVDLMKFGLPEEPLAQEAIKAGFDLVSFSGDKLLGGPQAGIVLGHRDLIEELKRNPLLRAIRVGKLTLAALESVLKIYLREESPESKLPHLRMILEPATEVRGRAKRVARKCASLLGDGFNVEVIEGSSQVGGGSYPGVEIPTWLVAIRSSELPPLEMATLLRGGEPPVVARVADDRLLFDLRTVGQEEIGDLVTVIAGLSSQDKPSSAQLFHRKQA